MRIARCSNARISGFFVALLFGLVFVFVVLQYWSTHPEADSFVGLDQEIPAFESSNPDQAFQLLNDRHHESPGDSVIAVALATVSGLKGTGFRYESPRRDRRISDHSGTGDSGSASSKFRDLSQT